MTRMAVSPDPDDCTDNEWEERSFADYHLEPHEKTALATIRTNIDAHSYNDAENCLHHIELLEHLANKLMSIMQSERSLGKENWDIEAALRDIKALQKRLSALYDAMHQEN